MWPQSKKKWRKKCSLATAMLWWKISQNGPKLVNPSLSFSQRGRAPYACEVLHGVRLTFVIVPWKVKLSTVKNTAKSQHSYYPIRCYQSYYPVIALPGLSKHPTHLCCDTESTFDSHLSHCSLSFHNRSTDPMNTLKSQDPRGLQILTWHREELFYSFASKEMFSMCGTQIHLIALASL